MIYKCSKCQNVFEKSGLQLIIHDVAAGQVCPECIAGAQTIHLVIERTSNTPTYELRHVDVQPPKP